MALGLVNVNWETFGQIVLVVAMTTRLVVPAVKVFLIFGQLLVIVNLELLLELQFIVVTIKVIDVSIKQNGLLQGYLEKYCFGQKLPKHAK